MVFGAVFPMVGLHYVLDRTYNVGRAFDDYNYWSDYRRNTGYNPRYPWRSGAYDYLKFANKVIW